MSCKYSCKNIQTTTVWILHCKGSLWWWSGKMSNLVIKYMPGVTAIIAIARICRACCNKGASRSLSCGQTEFSATFDGWAKLIGKCWGNVPSRRGGAVTLPAKEGLGRAELQGYKSITREAAEEKHTGDHATHTTSMVHTQLQWYTQGCNGSRRVAMVHAGFQWYRHNFNGTHRVAMVHTQLQLYTQGCNGTHRVALVHTGLQWYTQGCNANSYKFFPAVALEFTVTSSSIQPTQPVTRLGHASALTAGVFSSCRAFGTGKEEVFWYFVRQMKNYGIISGELWVRITSLLPALKKFPIKMKFTTKTFMTIFELKLMNNFFALLYKIYLYHRVIILNRGSIPRKRTGRKWCKFSRP